VMPPSSVVVLVSSTFTKSLVVPPSTFLPLPRTVLLPLPLPLPSMPAQDQAQVLDLLLPPPLLLPLSSLPLAVSYTTLALLMPPEMVVTVVL